MYEKTKQYIEEHVRDYNPVLKNGEERPEGKNHPFFTYLAFRGPHAPYANEFEFDPKNPTAGLPHASFGKFGELLWVFDKFIGRLGKVLYSCF